MQEAVKWRQPARRESRDQNLSGKSVGATYRRLVHSDKMRLGSWRQSNSDLSSINCLLRKLEVQTMCAHSQVGPKSEPPFVSTGRLPPAELVKQLVDAAHQEFKSNTDGKNSQVYPALAHVPSNLFGICVVGANGNVYAVGDSDHEFTIMSVSKPFVFALICEVLGPQVAREKIGMNATGRSL